MNDQMQRRLSTLLPVVIGTVLAASDKQRHRRADTERRGIKDYVTNAVLQGLVRTAAILAASVTVRRVASSKK